MFFMHLAVKQKNNTNVNLNKDAPNKRKNNNLSAYVIHIVHPFDRSTCCQVHWKTMLNV